MISDTTKSLGLTSAEVAQRVARGETNNFQAHVERTYWDIIRDNVFNIFNLILLVLVVILIPFGEFLSIAFASFSVVLNAIVGTIQEVLAKRSLDQLAALNAQTVKVYRDGAITEIPVSMVVKDDVLPLEPGDRAVVDGKVIRADSLEMDESLLTGESDAIHKEVNDVICSGSFSVAGSGVFVATEVGANSTVNRLSKTAKAYKNVQTPTQRKVAVFVELVLFYLILFGPMVVIAGMVKDLPTPEIVKNALVLVTSSVPQGLLLATTLSLTLGAVSISRHKTLVQRINAVESMANVQVLCFDKTGTLTRNALAVTDILPLDGSSPAHIMELLGTYVGNMAHQNKTAGAIADYINTHVSNNEKNNNGNGSKAIQVTKIGEIPFSSARKWSAVVFPDQTLVLGAPERVLSATKNKDALATYQQLSAAGQRVVALAKTTQPFEVNGNGKHKETVKELTEEREALALIVLSDQVRNEIRDTLNAFQKQNVELKVISGDNAETVSAIAGSAGMHVTRAYTGDELERMSEDQFAHAVLEANVFARIEPDTKRKIIASLRRQGRYTAMVGDGVNDVPALKEADLAIVMNDGTQISKDVADIVLLNNAMSTLPLAFDEGKLITQKIFGTAKLFLTKNVFHILLFLLVGFMALPFPINPIQISWMVFSTVNIPTILLAFGLLRPREMRHFGNDVMRYVMAGGMVGALSMTIVFAFVYLGSERDLRVARTAETIFMSMFGLVVFMNTMGVEFHHPQTFIKHWNIVLITVVLALIGVVPLFLAPRIFACVPLPFWVVVVMFGMFVISIMALHLARRQTRLLKQVRILTEA